MDIKIQNKLPLNIKNNMPPGSYIIRDGKLYPNLTDDAMKARHTAVTPDEKKSDDDKEEIKKKDKKI